MYSKTEVYFTVILTLTISWHLNSKQGTPQVAVQGSVVTVADGGHPPPPLPPPQYKSNSEVFRADGGHPPPPPWLSSDYQVS